MPLQLFFLIDSRWVGGVHKASERALQPLVHDGAVQAGPFGGAPAVSFKDAAAAARFGAPRSAPKVRGRQASAP